MAGRSAIAIELSETERGELASRLRRRKVGRGDAMRAQIVLLAAEGLSNVAIAARFGTTRVTVATWRRRFAAQRLEGLLDEPRPGAPRTVSDEKVAEVVTSTLESLPVGSTVAHFIEHGSLITATSSRPATRAGASATGTDREGRARSRSAT